MESDDEFCMISIRCGDKSTILLVHILVADALNISLNKTSVYLTVNHNHWSQTACAHAPARFDSEHSVFGYFACFDSQSTLELLENLPEPLT